MPPEGTRFVPLQDGRFATEPWTFPRVLFRFEERGAVATVDGYPVDRWERLGSLDLPATLAGCAGTYETAEAKPRSGIVRIELRKGRGMLLLRPVRTEVNERRPDILNDPAVLFPLRFTSPDNAEVVNGALSGFFGYRFIFKPGAETMELQLLDRLGATLYRKINP